MKLAYKLLGEKNKKMLCHVKQQINLKHVQECETRTFCCMLVEDAWAAVRHCVTSCTNIRRLLSKSCGDVSVTSF